MDKAIEEYFGFGGPGQVTRRSAREGKADVIVDKEQQQKFEEILELLLAAGYFRARISKLSRFDRVIGGLSWCITSSAVDVDADIFFQEDAQIGQKIKLAESIEKALIRMRCPYSLQAFQIQGLDFVSIFPVIQWLVKRVIEYREETGDLMRRHSEAQFNKTDKLPQDKLFEKRKESSTAFVGNISSAYTPRRKFKQQGKSLNNEVEQVQSTLLEYGRVPLFVAPTSEGSKQTSKMMQEAQARLQGVIGGDQDSSAKVADAKAAHDAHIKGLMQSMGEFSESRRVAGSVVTGYLDEDAIRQYNAEYASATAGMDAEQAQRVHGEEGHKRQVETRKRQISQNQEMLQNITNEYTALKEKLETRQSQHDKIFSRNQKIRDEIAKLDALETPENAPLLKKLRELVALNESLKTHEQQFRESCKQQLRQLKEKTEKLKDAKPTPEQIDKKNAIKEQYEKDKAKLKNIKRIAAKKYRDCAMVERKTDEFPSRVELQQYQRMFVELYAQVHSKLRETRQYYNMYNTLDDTRTFLSKEVSILESISENFETALKSKGSREKFLESLAQILSSVQSYLESTKTKLNVEQEKHDKLNEQYMALVEKERAYFKTTKEFQEECKKNELLQQRLAG